MSSESSGPTRHSGTSRRAFPVRARDLLKVRAVWILSLILGSAVVVLITAFYVGSVVDPLGHLQGLPVAVVNQDRGAVIGASYATVVIAPGFTASLLTRAGVSASGAGLGRPEIVILTNQRAGTIGASLASGVLQSGIQAASRQIGRQLAAFVPAGRAASLLTRDFLADPVTVTTAD
jgi:hypothetical protein